MVQINIEKKLIGSALILCFIFSCKNSPVIPEKGIKPFIYLDEKALVKVTSTVEKGLNFSPESLNELLLSSLEQSKKFEFVIGEKKTITKVSARIFIHLKKLPGSTERVYLEGEISHKNKEYPIRIIPRGTEFQYLLSAFDSLGRVIRRCIGEDINSIATSSVSLIKIIGNSYEALDLLAKAEIELEKNNTTQAWSLLLECLRKNPLCAKAVIDLGYIALSTGKVGTANFYIEKAGFLVDLMSRIDYHRFERLKLLYRDEYKKIIKAGERFINEFPGNPEGYITKGIGLNILGEYAKSEPIWKYLYLRNPKSTRICLQYGICLFGQKKFDLADNVWKYLRKQRFPIVQRAFLGALPPFGKKDYKDAKNRIINLLKEAKGSAKNRVWLNLMLCSVAIFDGNIEKAKDIAVTVIKDARADLPSTLEAWRICARYLIFIGAKDYVKAFISSIPINANSKYFLDIKLAVLYLGALIKLKENKQEEAEKAAKNLEKNGAISEAYEIFAMIPKNMNNKKQRLFYLNKAFLKEPSPWYAFLLGKALIEENETEKGKSLLKTLNNFITRINIKMLKYHPLLNPLTASALMELRLYNL